MRIFYPLALYGLYLLTAQATDFDIPRAESFFRRIRSFHSSSRSFSAISRSRIRRPPAIPTSPTPNIDTTKCFSQPKCPPVYYHNFVSLDGTCNNRVDKNRGRANRSYKRLIRADYADDRGAPRRGKYNRNLPSARLVSTTMSNSVSQESSDASHLVPLWGQYIVHDIAHTPEVEKTFQGDQLECECDSSDQSCFNIPIPDNDIQKKRERKNCFPLKRSVPVADSNTPQCDTSVRQQLNSISAYIDLGTIYGNSKSHLDSLLDPDSDIGEFKEQTSNYHGSTVLKSLPLQNEVNATISEKMQCPMIHKPRDIPCYVSGDIRVNENSALISQHTLWMRQHNRIAKELSRLNGHWEGALIFQKARAIVTALQQIITYGHFLPVIVGENYMKRFDLELVKEGHWYGYDSTYDATVANAFNTAAFRFGHSMIRGTLSRPRPSWTRNHGEAMDLKDSFFNSEPILSQSTGGIESLVRGFLKDKAQRVDTTFVEDLHNFLFAEPGQYGLDLMAMNIQRGRDHGLPSYKEYRKFCGLSVTNSFEDLDDISSENRIKLKSLYNYVNDIDLYIGGVSERPVQGGSVGPTFSCIISYQFRDIRKGDRFWHENGGIFQYFTSNQLDALRQASFSRLLCDVLPDMETIQPNPMRVESRDNRRKSCQSFQALDLTAWQEGAVPRSPENGYTQRDTRTQWTTWFPSYTSGGQKLSTTAALNYLLRHRPDEVCHQVLDTQTKKVRDYTLVRFQCSPGTIRQSDFPHVESEDVYWTKWVDNSTPDRTDGDDSEARTAKESGCHKPFAIQVQTVQGVPAGETGEAFEEFNVNMGFICRGKHQSSGVCSDYRVRYLCRRGEESVTKTTENKSRNHWTDWISTDDTDNSGDIEYLLRARSRMTMCSKPTDIEVRTVRGKIPVRETGDRIRQMNASYGFFCYHSDQRSGRCNDYEVRYKCSDSTTSLPSSIQEQKESLCRRHNVCC